MYACVIETQTGERLYSSFFPSAESAIEYAKGMAGVVAVERAHSGERPVWTRPT